MAEQLLYTNGGALAVSTIIGTMLENSTVKLYKAITEPLSTSTVVGDFTQADYSGYAEQVYTEWNLPHLSAENGGAAISAPLAQFDFIQPGVYEPVPNVVLGYYIQLDDGTLILAGEFAEPITMSMTGHSCQVAVTIGFGA